MGNMLGRGKPLKEVLRENKRMISRAVRELDREKNGLEREEQRLKVEIKKAAKENQMQSVKIMAKRGVDGSLELAFMVCSHPEFSPDPRKDLVRTRQYIAKFIEMRSHLQGCALKLQTVKSHQAMADAMQSTAKAMGKMNKAVNVPTLTKMMAEFEKENARTEMMQEVMGDMIDDGLAGEENEEEEERIVGQVLDEIGIDFQGELPETAGMTVPGNSVATGPAMVAVGGDDPALTDLEARLNNLKQ